MADITPIAHIETPFAEKFGVPRQSGIADCPDALCLRRRTAILRRCGDWRNSPISG